MEGTSFLNPNFQEESAVLTQMAQKVSGQETWNEQDYVMPISYGDRVSYYLRGTF